MTTPIDPSYSIRGFGLEGPIEERDLSTFHRAADIDTARTFNLATDMESLGFLELYSLAVNHKLAAVVALGNARWHITETGDTTRASALGKVSLFHLGQMLSLKAQL